MIKTLLLVSLASLATTASANDVFTKNCVACHANGRNMLNPQKTLSAEHMKANGYNSVEDIKTIVSKGKAPMPGFEGKLSADDIDSVSQYVWDQAQKGW